MKKILLYIVLFCLCESLQAQDTKLINDLVKEIAALQYEKEAPYNFHKGMFFSYKKWAGYPQRYSPDNNIFYTGIIAFALKNMQPHLSDENKAITRNIINNANTAYHYYQNKNKLPTYFFWQGGKPIMPNTYFVYKLSDAIATSEDIDDTVMLLMTMSTNDSIVKLVKQIMDSSANGQRRLITNSYKKYRNQPAHTTYLGKKMRIDFDFAVHCNVLYFLLENKLPFNKYDSATLNLVTQMVANKEYMKDPKFVAPYYISRPVILYHLTRLMSKFLIPGLEVLKQEVVADLNKELNRSTNIMDEIILKTSLLRMGQKVQAIPITSVSDFNKSGHESFVFYQARAASQLGNPLKRLLLNFSMLNYHFFSPAYNKVLLLEYLVETNKFNLKHSIQHGNAKN